MNFITTFFLPHFCVGCRRPGVTLCNACLHRVTYYEKQKCIYCGKGSYLGITHAWCKKKTPIDGAYSFFYYRYPLKEMLLRIKYRHNKQMMLELLQSIPVREIFLLWELKKIYKDLTVVSIPQTKKAFLERGFNQAAVIGDFFSQILHIPRLAVLAKVHETKHQSLLQESERWRNLYGAYAVTNNYGATIPNFLLIDDVITTGATVSEAAYTLKKTWEMSTVYTLSLLRAR